MRGRWLRPASTRTPRDLRYRRSVRAALIAELGSPPRPAELPDAPSGVRVVAVAVNPIDISVGNGRFYGGHPSLPYPPGCEAVGRTEDGALVYLFGDGRGGFSVGSSVRLESGTKMRSFGVGDVDGDDWCDIFLCGSERPSALYRNLGNWKFEDITESAGVACTNQYSTGAVFADVPGGNVTGNRNVWRQFAFANITTGLRGGMFEGYRSVIVGAFQEMSPMSSDPPPVFCASGTGPETTLPSVVARPS